MPNLFKLISGNRSVEARRVQNLEDLSENIILKFIFEQLKYLHQTESYIILFINKDLKKYFNSGNKKQELSNETSTSDDDPKKKRDGSLDDSNNPDNVFTKGLRLY